MIQKMKKPILWLFAVAVMLTAMVVQLPIIAAADVGTKAGAFTVTGGTSGTDYSYADNVLTILTNTQLTIGNTNTGSTTDRIVVASPNGADIILAGVNIQLNASNPALIIDAATTGNVKITLADGTENTLKGYRAYAGLQKSNASDYNLEITGGTNGTGKLTAKGGTAGIGGGGSNDTVSVSNITISGGIIEAFGSFQGSAGIGAASGGSASNITISGGTVTAKGADMGAGIGGGYNGSGTNIQITGGTVDATGGEGAAGIGGGKFGEGNSIAIENATVTATGGAQGNYGAAGIGGGAFCPGSDITITNSTVTATGGKNGAGIGGGCGDTNSQNNASCGTIKIIDSTVTAKGGENGAGIGGGIVRPASTIVIDGGSVKAVAGENANAIGGGSGKNYIVPVNNDGKYVFLREVENPNNDAVYIDDETYTISNHTAADSDDTKLYLYLGAGSHTIQVGEDATKKEEIVVRYGEGKLEFEITSTDGKELKEGKDYTYPIETSTLTILSNTPITIKNANPEIPTTNTIVVAKGVDANITLAGVNIDVSKLDGAAFMIADDSNGNVSITLAEGTTNTLISSENYAGLQKNNDDYALKGGTLTLKGTGTLIAKGGAYAPGIGGKRTTNITIESGTITATGGENGAGIGGGKGKTATNIKINGGSVKAVAGENANAIGGGSGQQPLVPSNNEGKGVFLKKVENPDGAAVEVDGTSYTPVNHTAADPADTNLYLYLTSDVHTIKVGDNSTEIKPDIDESYYDFVISAASDNPIKEGEDYTYEISPSSSTLIIKTGTPIKIANKDPNTATNHIIKVQSESAANVTLAGVNISTAKGSPFAIDSIGINTVITLAEGTTNILEYSNEYGYYAGLQKNSTSSMLIIQGTGSLTAKGFLSPGIGGGNNGGNGSNITINGGTVTAESKYGAGIGGGNNGGNGSDITINGGTVTAISTYGAGIGGGNKGGKGSDITINGGTVTATSTYGAGIGGGDYGESTSGEGSDITISGGTVTATSTYGAGIGGGRKGSGSDIKITGGSVYATSTNGNTIGGGNEGGAAITPTLADKTTPVYLREIDTTGVTTVTINGQSYPTKHGTENKIYVYLPAKTNIINVDGKIVKILYNTKNKKWVTSVDIPEKDETVFTYDDTAKTYKLATSEYYTINGSTTQTYAGTYTIELALKDPLNCAWSDGSTGNKNYKFTINKYPAPTIEDIEVFYLYTATGEQTIAAAVLPDYITTNAMSYSATTKSDADGILATSPNAPSYSGSDGKITFTLNGNTADKIGSTATILIKVDMGDNGNYENVIYNVIVTLAKAEQAAPSADDFTIDFTVDSSSKYTATINTALTGVEYSFDGKTWSSSNTKTNIAPHTAVTAYIRYKETEAYRTSDSVSNTAKTGHGVLTHHVAIPKKCLVDGNIEYWTCSFCNNYYSDANGKTEITQADTVDEHIGHVCDNDVWEKDSTGHWHACANCTEKVDFAAHNSSGAATADTAETCTICGYEINPRIGYVAAPAISPSSGIFGGTQRVTITCATEGATIYYTTDGSTPTAASTKYTGAFTITATTTVKAFAVKNNMGNSSVVTAEFTFIETVSTPVITPNGGTFKDTQEVTITCATEGATIYYTTDGSTPTEASTVYTGAFTINKTTTVKAIAVKDGMADSEVVTVKLTKKSSGGSGGGGTGGGGTGGGGTGGGGGNSNPTPSKPVINGKSADWTTIASEIANMAANSEITIELNGNYDVPVEVIKAIADKDIKATFVIDSWRSWKLDGAEISAPAAADLKAIQINSLTTSALRGTVGIEFRLDGTNNPTKFSVTFKSDFAGKFANLYKLDGDKLVFVDVVKVDENGNALLPAADKGDYVIMLSDFSDLKGDVSNDGKLDISDASMLLKAAFGLVEANNPEMLDYNGDGKTDIKDASELLKHIFGK